MVCLSTDSVLRRIRGFACVVVLAMSASSFAIAESRNSEWAVPIAKDQNLYQVTPNFYRSAKLNKKSVATLQHLGIRTIVSLRAYHSDKPLLKDSPIRVVRIPINTWSIKDDDVIRALRAIRDAEKEGPVLLHCLHGADRTGLVTAMYRIVFRDWSKENALDELENGGYGYHAIWKNIPKYINAVDIARIKEALDQAPQ